MNSDPPGKQQRLDDMRRHAGAELNVSDRSKPLDVPVFSCVVYVSSLAEGGVRARVANLPGLEETGTSEREALSKIVAAFKRRVSELIQREAPIPWIEPPSSRKPEEKERLIPVHL